MGESEFRLPPTNPDGGWARVREPLPAPALDLTAPPTVIARPIATVELRTQLLAPPAAGHPAEPSMERDRRGVARYGLRMLLSGALGADPEDVVIDDEACPHCGVVHDCTAAAPGAGPAPVHFASLIHRGLAVHALADTPVGLGLAVPDGPAREAMLRARKPARLAAGAGAVARGSCAAPRTAAVARAVEYVDVPQEQVRVVSVVWQERHRP
ncbi:hypothetical protein [Streptomyces lasiicapitis]|uniref:Uncharacterized protein n=1 Tax=Streptomyces lasiicapitis TaxID=1923961 RepID=A0ABQ2MNX6_9ACTN|nr:hypothetical protein [Streptomyces lasiicapitis]GGO54747.1 hypothetical protein GCM10012286_65240 [Streptomyces lasiicapitis]